MRFLRVSYDEFGLQTTIAPATAENPSYVAALRDRAAPFHLALLIDKMSEDAARKVLAEVYAESVVMDHGDLGKEGWVKWFLSHPDEFLRTVHVAEHPDLWEDMCDGR